MQILGELTTEEKYESGCLVMELNAQTCRNGCQICFLHSKLDHIKRVCPDIREGPGEFTNIAKKQF